MTQHNVSIDIETYSDIDIKKAGLYKYALSPAFDILLIAWAVDDRPVRIVDLCVDPGADGAGREFLNLQDFLHDLYDEDNTLHAYNAAFEHFCLNVWLARAGRSEIPLHRWRCTMAHGQYCGYTAGLAATGEALGLPQDKRKMGIGGALIRKFCVPQKADRSHPEPWRLRPQDEPEKWSLFKEYCKQDVETERTIGRRLRRWPMPDREQDLWELTCEANIRGVGVDMDLVRAAIHMGAEEQARLTNEARAISGLENPKSVQQLMKWLNKALDTDDENEITDLRKATVEALLKAGVNNALAERMLEIRQRLGKTSTTKYNALAAAAQYHEDGYYRVHGLLQYYGANRTGRWAGRIVQPQNLPQNHLNSLEYARECAKAEDTDVLELCFGALPDTLSQLIRTAFIPTPTPTTRGSASFCVADYSAIEARVVAWLAGETWVLDAFRDGKDIYCATASQMFGVPVEKHGENAHLRQRGKVATLALGYGGGESALINMGALKMGIPEDDLEEIKMKWRRANPRICALWRRTEDAAIAALQTGRAQTVQIKIDDAERARENEALCGAPAGSYSDRFNTGAAIVFRKESDPATDQEFLTIQLPTGRKLFYAHPFLAPAKNFPDRQSLHYYGVNQTSKKWTTTDTWGGKLVENITQAVARDCLAETLLTLRGMGLNPVFHVHDEVIVEVGCPDPQGVGSNAPEAALDTILGIMARPVPWAPGLPLKGAGFVCEYYQKD